MATKKKPHDLVRANCCFPTAQHPYYHIRLAFTVDGTARYQIKLVKVNGVRVRDFAPFHNGCFMKDSELGAGGHSELVLRWDWKAGEESSVEVTADGPTGSQPLALKARIAAPGYGGYWDPAWKYYASLVCTETAGIDRRDEPVHTNLAVYSDRIQDPERELRVVAVDSLSGAHREVPCQVHEGFRSATSTSRRPPSSSPSTPTCPPTRRASTSPSTAIPRRKPPSLARVCR
jgi:hypothetical protein